MMKLSKKTGWGTVSLIVLASLAVLMCKVTGAGTGADTAGVEKSYDQTVVWTINSPVIVTDGTAELGLGFGPVVPGLIAADFTIDGGGGGITAETLEGSGAERILYVSNVPEDDIVKISVSKAGITFDPPFYTWNTRTGEITAGPAEPPKAATAPELTALAVEYDGENGNLITGFSPATKTYLIFADAGKSVIVSQAEPEDDASVSIRHNNDPLVIGVTTVAVPAEGAEAKVISITAEKDALSSEYRVVIAPPQNSATDDRSLMYLDVFYEDEYDSLISFSKSITDYTVNVSEQKASSRVRLDLVIPSSSLSNADSITYGVDREHAVAVAKDELVAVPATGTPAKKFFVEVQSDNKDTQSYIITINPYTPPAQTNTWSGTVTLNSLAGKTAVQVIARGADTHQSHTAAVSDGNWTLDAPKSFVPVSFIVSVTDSATSTGTWRSRQYKPSPLNAGTPIDLVVEGAPEVGKAVFSAEDLKNFKNAIAENYSLADDITLPVNWNGGPENYSGKFYGNGYTIDNLQYQAITTLNIGLFNSLAGAAELRDFTLVVVPSSPSVSDNVRFGGVVGNVLTGGNAIISGVTVTGTLALGALNNNIAYLYIGGILGELSTYYPLPTVTIENCVSTLNIIADSLGTKNVAWGGDGIRVGGFVGKHYNGTINIRNSYSSGNITVIHGGSGNTGIGGFTGYIDSAATSNTVENCYSASVINSTHSNINSSDLHHVGGLIGTMYKSALSNSVALNPSINVSSGGTLATGRAVGVKGSGTIANVYALSTMGGAVSTAGDGAADGVQGLAQSVTDLQKESTWTTELDFSGSVWDFSPLSSGGWPVLK